MFTSMSATTAVVILLTSIVLAVIILSYHRKEQDKAKKERMSHQERIRSIIARYEVTETHGEEFNLDKD